MIDRSILAIILRLSTSSHLSYVTTSYISDTKNALSNHMADKLHNLLQFETSRSNYDLIFQ